MIVRKNQTLKHLLEGTIKDLQINNTQSVCLVVNDIDTEGKGYGYGYGSEYGYGYGYGYSHESKSVKEK
jgi:tyrosine-protein kinase Etk/Wzc